MFFNFSVHPCERADKGGCSQTCEKDGDDAKCGCLDGYALGEDGKECEKSKFLPISFIMLLSLYLLHFIMLLWGGGQWSDLL